MYFTTKSKVRQVKEVGEIVLSVRIRPCVYVCVGADKKPMTPVLKLDHDLDVHLTY